MTTYFQKANRIKVLSAIIFALIIMMFFSSQIVFAEGENVCAIGSEEYGSLEDAIEAAESGDTITLLSDIDQLSTINISGKVLTLDGSGFTIKAANSNYSILTITASSAVTLTNIILDGNKNNAPIISTNASKLFIEDGAIIENGTSTDGYLAGGLVNRGGGTVTMNGGYIRNNSGPGSGGVYNVQSTFTMNGGVISGNSVSREDRGGGGIHNMDGRIVLNGGTITENTSGGAGGGVYIEWGNIVVNNCTITNNTAKWGGGILMSYPAYSYIYNATITGNHANGSGGGVYVAGSDWYGGHHLWIYGGTIAENTAVDYAGGIYTGSGANWDGVFLVYDPEKNPDGPRLHNNSAGRAGDDLYCPSNSGTHLKFTDMDKYGLTLNEDGCGYPITGWFNDDVNNRYNAHDLSKPLHVVEVPERTNGGYGGNLSFQGLKAAHHILSVTYKDGVDEEAFPDQVIPNNHINQDTPAFDGIPTREGFAFIGWTPEVAEKVTEDAVYTAQWKEAVKITAKKVWEDGDDEYGLRPENLEIVLKGDDGSIVRATLDGTADDVPSTAEPVGYEIEPWMVSFENLPKENDEDAIIVYTVEEGTCPENYECKVTGDSSEGFTITNTCTYEPPKIYEITYKLNGGEYEGSEEDIIESYEGGTVIDIHEAPARDGYEFLYWEGSKYHPGDKYTVTENHTFTAQWKEVVKIIVRKVWEDGDDEYGLRPENLEIVLKGDDGSIVTATLDGTADDVPSAAEPVGYEIEPWVVSFENLPKEDEEDSIIVYTAEEGYCPENYQCKVTGDSSEGFTITNTCTYEPPKIYEITYKLNGGEYEGSEEDIIESYEDGTVIDIHEAPARDGYEFLYWEGSEYHPGDKYTVTENHTLTAQWKEVKSPDDPEEPDTPSDPSDPDDPEDPDTPSNPSDPDTPAEPDKPSEPSKPDKPAEPDKPSEPSRPANPEKTSSPGRPVPSGDNENAGLWIGLATLSLFGIAVDVVLRRRHS